MTATVDNLWKSPERLCIAPGGGEVGGSLDSTTEAGPGRCVNTPEALAIGAAEEPLMTSHQSICPEPAARPSALERFNLIRSTVGHAIPGREEEALRTIGRLLFAADPYATPHPGPGCGHCSWCVVGAECGMSREVREAREMGD